MGLWVSGSVGRETPVQSREAEGRRVCGSMGPELKPVDESRLPPHLRHPFQSADDSLW